MPSETGVTFRCWDAYRPEDVNALIEYYEASEAVEDGIINFDLHREAVDRAIAAKVAITPELLERCRR